MKIDKQDLQAKSDQINSVDLVAPIICRIVKVKYIPGDKQCVWLFLEGYEKRPYKPCLSMRRGLVQAWGDEMDDWSGNLIEIYCDPSVPWAGEATGGIRISAISGIAEPFQFTIQLNRKQRKIETWDVIPDDQVVTKEFIVTHYQSEIAEADSNEAIDLICKNIRAEFGEDRMLELKDDVVKAREKFK